jgi:hypothetical protein
MWAEAERISGNVAGAVELAQEAVTLLDQGSPSLLNESPVYLALHDAYVDLGDESGAHDAIRRGLPALVRRLQGLVGTPYARLFLTELPHNARLLAAAEDDGLVPESIQRVLAGSGT